MNRRKSHGWVRGAMLALLVVAGLMVAAGAYVVINPTALVPVAVSAVERYLGRALTIDGEVAIELSGTPRISVSDARFGNAAGSTHPHMVTAEYLMVQIDLAALLDERVHILDLELRDAEIRLEDPVDGPPNWVFAEQTGEGDPSTWRFALEGLSVVRTVVHASIGELAPIELRIPHLEETTDADGNLLLEGNGQLNGDTWQVSGRIGTFDELLAAGRVDMSLDAVIDEVRLRAAGTIGDLASLSAVDLALALSGPNADAIGEIFGMPEAFAGKVALDATIRPTDDGHAAAVKGNISQFQIETTGTVRDLVGLDGWAGVVDVSGPDVQVFGKALQIPGFPQGPFEVAGKVRRNGGDLDFSDVRATTPSSKLILNADFVDFPRWQGAVGHLQVLGPDIRSFATLLKVPHLPVAPFELNLALDATSKAALDASLKIGEHRLTAAGPLGEFPGFDGTQLTATASGPDLAVITRLAGATDTLTGAYDARAVVSLTGGGVAIADAAVKVAPFELSGSAALPDLRSPERFTASVHLDTADFAQGLTHLGVQEVERIPAGPMALDVRIHGTADGLVLDRLGGRLPALEVHANGKLGDPSHFPAGLDLAVTVSGTDIAAILDQSATDDAATQIPFTLKGGLRGSGNAIEIRDASLAAEGGEFRADGRVSLVPDLIGTRMSVAGTGRNLSRLIPSVALYTPPAQPWRVGGTLDIPGSRHIRVTEGRLEVGTVNLTLSGSLDLEAQSGTNLDLSVRGDSLTEIGRLGPQGFPAVPFSLDLALDGTPSDIRVSRLEARWAQSDLSATGALDTSATPRLTLQGSSEVMHTEDLMVVILGEAYGDSEAPDTAAGASSRMFSDDPLPLYALRAMDANVNVTVGTLHDRRARLRDVALEFDLSNGTLAFTRVHFRDEIGRFDASGVLRPEGQAGRARVEWSLKAEDADLGIFTTERQPPDTIPRYTLDVSATGTGASLAEIAGSLNGNVLVHSMAGGRIDNDLVDRLAGDFVSNVLDVLNPFAGSEKFTPVNCLVLNAVIEDGNLQLVPGFVMRTDQVNMFVFGRANLATEHLDLSLATQARRGIGISAASITNPYFKVGGTITRPSLRLDPQSAAVAAGVATATAGLSIVIQSALQRIRGHTNPCPAFRDFERKPG